MHKRSRVFSTAALIAVFVIGMLAVIARPPISGQTAANPDIAQGQYMMSIANCAACHGANFGGVPANPNNPADTNFVPRPKIAGLPMFANDADAVKFLETGVLPDGSKPKRPMPPYNFHHNDAVAITAYLRSLKTP
jgi:mono/diheme cytochrome c family protein